jgi:GNAT superfamily N-acetyltransferase
MPTFALRSAAANDARFLADMLVEASNWHPTRKRPRVQLLVDPRVSRYIAGWMRPGDDGMIAEDTHGVPIGACWYRRFTADDSGEGFVAPGVPELTLGVSPIWRAQGVGRSLLRAVIARARSSGYAQLSLSVEHDNFAHRLYVSEGFVTTADGRGPTAETMVRALR